MVDVNSSRFDGFQIDEYRARFSGTFDVELIDGQRLQHGDEVLIVLTAKVANGVLGETPVGDIRRTNVLKPLEVTFVFDKGRQAELRTEHSLPPVPQSHFVPPTTSVEMDDGRSFEQDDRDLTEDELVEMFSQGEPVSVATDVEVDIDETPPESTPVEENEAAPRVDYPPAEEEEEVFTVQKFGGLKVKRDKMLANFLESSL